jgi:hypothetical protein
VKCKCQRKAGDSWTELFRVLGRSALWAVIVLVDLKFAGVISWSWWAVFAPSLVVVSFFLLVLLAAGAAYLAAQSVDEEEEEEEEEEEDDN